MEESEVINIGDGRYVHKTEDGVFRPLPPPKRKWLQHNRHEYDPERHPPREHVPKKQKNGWNHRKHYTDKIVGYAEYRMYGHDIGKRYGNVGRDVGHPWGVRKGELKKLQRRAAKQVKIDMENIKKNHEVDPRAEEALEGALTVLRAPNNQTAKLHAAKLILEFTKSKPVAKSEVSVNKAEEWLASLTNEQ